MLYLPSLESLVTKLLLWERTFQGGLIFVEYWRVGRTRGAPDPISRPGNYLLHRCVGHPRPPHHANTDTSAPSSGRLYNLLLDLLQPSSRPHQYVFGRGGGHQSAKETTILCLKPSSISNLHACSLSNKTLRVFHICPLYCGFTPLTAICPKIWLIWFLFHLYYLYNWHHAGGQDMWWLQLDMVCLNAGESEVWRFDVDVLGMSQRPTGLVRSTEGRGRPTKTRPGKSEARSRILETRPMIIGRLSEKIMKAQTERCYPRNQAKNKEDPPRQGQGNLRQGQG